MVQSAQDYDSAGMLPTQLLTLHFDIDLSAARHGFYVCQSDAFSLAAYVMLATCNIVACQVGHLKIAQNRNMTFFMLLGVTTVNLTAAHELQPWAL